MFDAPLDSMYVWFGVGMVSVVVAGVALGLPTAAPPSPAPVADAIDRVASSPNQALTSVALRADRIRLSTDAIALATDGGTARARLAFGPVTPVGSESLRAILDGTPPHQAFITDNRFEQAVQEARRGTHRWQAAPATLTIRRVRWGDVNATLVG